MRSKNYFALLRENNNCAAVGERNFFVKKM